MDGALRFIYRATSLPLELHVNPRTGGVNINAPLCGGKHDRHADLIRHNGAAFSTANRHPAAPCGARVIMTTKISQMLEVVNIAVSRAAGNPDFADRQSVQLNRMVFPFVGKGTFAPTKTDTRREGSAAQPQSRVRISKLRLSSRPRESRYCAERKHCDHDFLNIFHSCVSFDYFSFDYYFAAAKYGLASGQFHWTKVLYCRSTRFVLSSWATVEKKKIMKSQSRKLLHCEIAIVGLAFLWSGSSAFAQRAESQVMTTTTSDTEQAPKLPSGEVDSLVAPIALYSDPLLAQTLAASTYPLEIIQLQQWMDRNKGLKGKALADAVAKQPWDPSVQGLVEFPDVVQRMAGNVQWTTDLGNAFLAQQSDVMDAVQRMRAKAQGTGNLKTSAQQVVQTQTVEGGKQVIVVQQANPDVVYVPSYDPAVVYGPPVYPYPPIYYPPPGYYAAGAAVEIGR